MQGSQKPFLIYKTKSFPFIYSTSILGLIIILYFFFLREIPPSFIKAQYLILVIIALFFLIFIHQVSTYQIIKILPQKKVIKSYYHFSFLKVQKKEYFIDIIINYKDLYLGKWTIYLRSKKNLIAVKSFISKKEAKKIKTEIEELIQNHSNA